MQYEPKPQNDFSKVKEKISEIEEKSSDGDYIFRGETECNEKVSSTLWRELDAIKAKYSDIKEIQDEIVMVAKEHVEDKTSDFEILTNIQHYGGKNQPDRLCDSL